HRLVDAITDPELDWVGAEPRGVASVITLTALGVYTIARTTGSKCKTGKCTARNLLNASARGFPQTAPLIVPGDQMKEVASE
ncbi:hypothetical protein A2U01_0090928, partial [Trifolium medium]|nr:hypothetical protein [Trifolium medium]